MLVKHLNGFRLRLKVYLPLVHPWPEDECFWSCGVTCALPSKCKEFTEMYFC
jgi:hypothetical protein